MPYAAAAGAIGLTLGVAGTLLISRLVQRIRGQDPTPDYPGDWFKKRELLAADDAHQGYFKGSARAVLRANLSSGARKLKGAMRLGHLMPRVEWFKWVPELWPLTRLRSWLKHRLTTELWIPYAKRFLHLAVLGATGKGKSSSFAVPALVMGAFEKNTSYFSIDVKSPQFLRMFLRLWRSQGKEVQFFDPWTLEETMGVEPLWRASTLDLNEIAEVIAKYSPQGEPPRATGNSEYFSEGAARIGRGLVELAQFWPRRYCNLPSITQLTLAGHEHISAAFENALVMQPTHEEVAGAAETIIPLTESELRSLPRAPEVNRALKTLDRAGYHTAALVRRMRRFYREHREGALSSDKFEKAESHFWVVLREEVSRRTHQLKKLVESQGEYLEMPKETKGSMMTGLSNKLAYFKDPNIARAFSRDEADPRAVGQRPMLFLMGAHMSYKKIGALFVASILTNLAITALYRRGSDRDAGKAVWDGGAFYLLDEFPQLGIRDASEALALFRGFGGSLTLIYQSRGQLKNIYQEDAQSIETNTNHVVLLQGTEIESCEHYAKNMKKASVRKRSTSGVQGEKKSVSESYERMPLLDPADLKDMRVNGRVREKLAMSMGTETPAFPFYPLPFFEDPFCRRALNMERKVVRKEAWKFWTWQDRWSMPEQDERDLFTIRKKRDPMDPLNDPVTQRLNDPYGQYLDFLIGKPTEVVTDPDGNEVVRPIYDELVVPDLDLKEITGEGQESEPDPFDPSLDGWTAPPPPPRKPTTEAPPVVDPPPSAPLAPIYPKDLQRAMGRTFAPDVPLEALSLPGGPVEERIDEYAETS